MLFDQREKCYLTSSLFTITYVFLKFPQQVKSEEVISKAPALSYGSFGKSADTGYNAPHFRSVVHLFVFSAVMQEDNEDRKDKVFYSASQR